MKRRLPEGAAFVKLCIIVGEPEEKANMPTIFNVRCPSCGRDADSRIDIYSGLGPAVLECPRCSAVFDSGRTEWDQMSVWGRLWYALYSVLTVAAGSTGVGFASGFAYTAARTLQESVREAPLFIVIPSIAFWATVLLALQTYRLFASRRRTDQDEPRPFRAAYWNLQLGMQGRLLVWGFLWIGGCAVVGLVARGFG
jgi:hypothetical protein